VAAAALSGVGHPVPLPAYRLLAFVAWQPRNGALGSVALETALTNSPRYSMALLPRDFPESGHRHRRRGCL